MNLKLHRKSADTIKCDCLLVSAGDGGKSGISLGSAAAALDGASGATLGGRADALGFSGRLGQAVMLDGLPGVATPLVVLVGSGKDDALSTKDFNKMAGAAMKAARAAGAQKVASFLGETAISGQDAGAALRLGASLAVTESYSYTETKKPKDSAKKLKQLELSGPDTLGKGEAQAAIDQGKAIGGAVNAARELGNLPGNICTPRYLARHAQALARKHDSLTTKVLTEKEMEKLGMNVLLSVAQGSAEPPRLICVEHRPAKSGAKRGSTKQADAPVVLLGKGITFDTGGISLKPGAAMDEMKFDMCGAASVLGTIAAVAEMNLPINVVAMVAAAENMPSSTATKPGDVFTSMSGQTVEVLNTDAEGRLVLCDALTYAERYKPAAVIDVATLTGACVIALGPPASGLWSNDQPLADALLDAGQRSNDRAWQMPLWDDYAEMLHSNFADLANIGGRAAGAVTAAVFLSHFSKAYPWAHLDIAASAWNSGKRKGATGRPVRLLLEYLLARVRGASAWASRRMASKLSGQFSAHMSSRPM